LSFVIATGTLSGAAWTALCWACGLVAAFHALEVLVVVLSHELRKARARRLERAPGAPATRKRWPPSTKWLVGHRQKWLCGECYGYGLFRFGPDVTLDHIRPLSQGGADALANLQLTCPPCDAAKTRRADYLTRRRPAS
jgi:hypothetical protein